MIIKEKKNLTNHIEVSFKKRWQEYTEELYKKDLHDQDNHNGVITHLEPDILECGQLRLRKHYNEHR